jgi:hypothetical protein
MIERDKRWPGRVLRRRWTRLTLAEMHRGMLWWLRLHFPAPYPVRVGYRAKIMSGGEPCFGECWREGREIVILIRKRQTRRESIDALLHEWAHAHTRRHANMEDKKEGDFHDPEFYLAYGRMDCALYDHGGRQEILEWLREN